MARIARVVMWLLVMWMGFEMGAGVYEARVLVPIWASSPPESIERWHNMGVTIEAGPRFWIWCTPSAGMLALATLALSFTLRGAGVAGVRAGSSLILLVAVATFAWFVPLIMKIYGPDWRLDPDISRKAVLWAQLNWIRAVVYLVGWMTLLFGAIGVERGTARA